MPYNAMLAVEKAREKASKQEGPPAVVGSPCTAAVNEVIKDAGGKTDCTKMFCSETKQQGEFVDHAKPGTIILFKDGERIAHAMISLGNGDAAGCNNGCIGGTPAPVWQTMKIQFPIKHNREIKVCVGWPT